MPKAFQNLVAIPVTPKDYRIKSDSCCEKDDFTEKPCCRKGYTLKNESCGEFLLKQFEEEKSLMINVCFPVKDCSTTGETNLMTREPDNDCPSNC